MATDPNLLVNVANSGGLAGPAFLQNYQAAQAATQAAQQAQQQQMQAQAAAQQKQSDLQAYFNDPTPDKLVQLSVKYPQDAAAYQKSYDIMDSEKKDSITQQYSGLYNAATNGRTDLLIQQVQGLRDAESKQGVDTSEADDALRGLQSSDPDQITKATNFVKGIAQFHLAAANPKFADAIGIGKAQDGSTVVGPGGALVDKATGKVLYSAPGAPHYETIKNADGSESVVEVGGGGQASGAGGGGGSAAPGGQGTPLSVRLNNPGAIRFNPANNWQGQVGQQGGFVQFATAADGQRAHQILIANQIKAGYDTPLKWAQHYAPASDGNNPQAYAQSIARALGIGVNDQMSLSAVPRIAAASAAVESGGTPAPQGQAGGSAQGNGARVLFTSQGASSADGTPGDATKQAGAYLQTLPSNIASMAQAIVQGRQAWPTSFALSKPYWQQVIAAAEHLDPTVDSSTQPARVIAMKQFTGNGTAARSIASANRLAYHANDLYQVSQQLDGPDLGWAPLSNLATKIGQSSTGQQALVKQYNIELQGIAGELQKLTKNGTATVQETKEIMDQLRPDQPSAVRLAGLQAVAKLAQGQFAPFRQQWAAAFPDRQPPIDVSPVAQAVYDHIGASSGPLRINDANGQVVRPVNRRVSVGTSLPGGFRVVGVR